MSALLDMVHFLAGLIVMAEALNKLERTHVLERGLAMRARATVVLKAVAWSILAMGGGGALVRPLLGLPAPTLDAVCVLLGFAVLIVRTRVKEG